MVDIFEEMISIPQKLLKINLFSKTSPPFLLAQYLEKMFEPAGRFHENLTFSTFLLAFFFEASFTPFFRHSIFSEFYT